MFARGKQDNNYLNKISVSQCGTHALCSSVKVHNKIISNVDISHEVGFELVKKI